MMRKFYHCSQRCLLALALLMTGLGLQAALNGTYTINAGAPASATNYQSVSAAISDLMSGTRADAGPINGPGVSGPVTLRITAGSGPYTEQISIGAIAGTSATNYVRLTGGPTRETITWANTTTTDRHTLRLSGTKNIILDSLTLVNTNTTFGYGVWITNNSDSNYVQNCRIKVDSTVTTANVAGLALSGSTPTTAGNNGDYNTIRYNIISGGYYSVSIQGTSTTVYGEQNHVIGNELRSFYFYGLRHYQQNAGILRNNIIHGRATSANGAYGAYVYYNKDFTFEANRIYDVGTYRAYFAYTNFLGSVISGTSHIRNNLIGGTNINNATTYGLYLTTQSHNNNIYNNTVNIATGDGRALYITTGSGNNVRNNSFSIFNTAAGYAAYVAATTYIASMDYNNYYSHNSPNFVYVGVAYTPGTYVGGGGFNFNSRAGDPSYRNIYSDLHATGTQLYDGGDISVNITTDYDGDPRPHPSTNIPDIGADEYMPDSLDVAVLELLSPIAEICPDSNAPVRIVIQNKGTNTLNNIPLQIDVTGPSTFSLPYVHPGPMPIGDRDTVTVGSINTWPGGTFSFTAYLALVGDQSTANDTLRTTRAISLTPLAPTGQNDTLCAGDSTTLVASGTGVNFYWYDAAIGGNLLATGTNFNTGSITNSTSYYVSNTGLVPKSKSTTFVNNNNCGGGNMFEVTAYNDILVDSFDLNLSAGTVNVDVYYKVGGYAGFETTPTAWTLLGSGTATSTGTGQPTRLTVGGLNIPAGQTYAIYIYTTTMVYTSLSSITNYSNPDLNISCGVGLCSLFGGTNNPRGWNGRLYYTTEGCESPRTPLAVTVNPLPSASLSDTAACDAINLDGGIASTYVWSTGDSTQTITVNSSGTYGVTISDNYGCTNSDSAAIVINVSPTVYLGADTLLCDGASLDVDAGFPGSSYAWSSGQSTQSITVSAAGTYVATVTDPNGCDGVDDITITTLNSPSGSISIDTSNCPTIQFVGNGTGGTANSTTWLFGDGNSDAGTSTSHTYTSNGTYTVSWIQSNACGTDTVSTTITLTCLVGTTAPIAANVRIAPNPTRDAAKLYFDLPVNSEAMVRILDLKGRTLSQRNLSLASGSQALELDLTKLSAGLYFVELTAEGLHWQGRLVKE